jgi:phospholipid/cholesterol/gamma-HCH transport system substrate-binding protein
MRRFLALALCTGLVLTACGVIGGSEERTYGAMFSRAIQVFPGGKVRVLGVDVGVVKDVENAAGAVQVTFVVEDPEVELPADVEAAIVPASLLGERYIQLFPAYQGGPALQPGGTIPVERTAVPSEPDELLRSLQDYLGAIDPEAVRTFVENAADILEGNGEELNELIRHAAGVIGTLAAKRDDLARIIVEFERLTNALLARKAEVVRVIRAYNEVVGTLTENRAALEGSIIGLNEMAIELASLLHAHRGALDSDIDTLTTTGRTLRRNVQTFAATGHWATRLFHAAERAVDFEAEWLRLNNQFGELPGLILQRLKQRLVEVCQEMGLRVCDDNAYWSHSVPALFCFTGRCPTEDRLGNQPPEKQLAEAIEGVPPLANSLLEQFRQISCANADDVQQCLRRKRILIDCARSEHPRQCLRENAVLIECLRSDSVRACIEENGEGGVQDIVDELLDETIGSPETILPEGVAP